MKKSQHGFEIIGVISIDCHKFVCAVFIIATKYINHISICFTLSPRSYI